MQSAEVDVVIDIAQSFLFVLFRLFNVIQHTRGNNVREFDGYLSSIFSDIIHTFALYFSNHNSYLNIFSSFSFDINNNVGYGRDVDTCASSGVQILVNIKIVTRYWLLSHFSHSITWKKWTLGTCLKKINSHDNLTNLFIDIWLKMIWNFSQYYACSSFYSLLASVIKGIFKYQAC